jgi:urease accessory protein
MPRPAPTITTPVRTIMHLDPAALVRLLCFASPAFPTGGFAYSQGLESAVEAADVTDEPSLLAWLEDVIRYGTGRSDSILLRHAHRAHSDPDMLRHIASLASAACISAERQAETNAQGAAFVASAAAWQIIEEAPYPVAFGALAARADIEEDAACLGFLAATASNLISAALRLGPLGQAGGLRVLKSLEAAIKDVANDTRSAELEDIGGACFLADIAAMRHETQYSRLFRS